MAIDTLPQPNMTKPASRDIPKQPEAASREQAAQDYLGALLRARECAPLTEEEVRQATQRHNQASHLLAATVVHRTIYGNDTCGFSSYIAHEKATRDLAGIPASASSRAMRNLPNAVKRVEETRRAQRASLKATIQEHDKMAASFEKTLGVVGRMSDDFETRYAPEGKPDFDALDGLYDTTDGLDSPILAALPNANAYEGHRRDAIVRADRILRYMLDQAFQNQQSVA